MKKPVKEKVLTRRCKRCNRILKTPQAIARGYGYNCWKRYQMENPSKEKDLFDIVKNLK